MIVCKVYVVCRHITTHMQHIYQTSIHTHNVISLYSSDSFHSTWDNFLIYPRPYITLYYASLSMQCPTKSMKCIYLLHLTNFFIPAGGRGLFRLNFSSCNGEPGKGSNLLLEPNADNAGLLVVLPCPLLSPFGF